MLSEPASGGADVPLLAVDRLVKRFDFGRRWLGKPSSIHAVDDVSFDIRRGETLALVGESGCGKSTVANLVMQLLAPTSGTIRVEGRTVSGGESAGAASRTAWRRMQMVFQDPYASLNPRMRAIELVAEPLVNFGIGDRASRARRGAELLERVGLPASMHRRYAHEFSGGQRQRLGIARALALEPALIVADEPVSALDVSVQAQILNLLQDLKRDHGLAFLFVSHDLGVVEFIADMVAVMYLGAIVERAPARSFFAGALHPYSQALIESVPPLDPRERRSRPLLQGDVPSAAALPSGCRFRTRCPLAAAVCAQAEPPLREIGAGRHVACHFVEPGPGGHGAHHKETRDVES